MMSSSLTNTVNALRNKWEFDYTAKTLAEAAIKQRDFRLSRIVVWKEKNTKVMAEIKESGIEITESLAAQMSNYTSKGRGPQVTIREDLEQHLLECHSKIDEHQQAAAEYDGWVQVLSANPENRLKLTQADWLYFFGK